MFNRNIRCIEISLLLLNYLFLFYCSTETLDVLKFNKNFYYSFMLIEFNRNIGCIEILKFRFKAKFVCSLFNRNIRCIEILIYESFFKKPPEFNRNIRCIEIAFTTKTNTEEIAQFNRNIRCIEIIHQIRHQEVQFYSTETLDVLKYFYRFLKFYYLIQVQPKH